MVLQHIVEGPECHPWTMIPSSKCYIIMPCEVRRKRVPSLLFLMEDIVNYF